MMYKPIVNKVDVDFLNLDSLCIVDVTKGSHADLTDEYAATMEMKKQPTILVKRIFT